MRAAYSHPRHLVLDKVVDERASSPIVFRSPQTTSRIKIRAERISD